MTKTILMRILRAMTLAACGAACTLHAADFPTKPIRILVGFSPGGSNDLIARIMAQKLSADLGQQVTVDNRPGANGNIAADALLKALPDGHTLMICTAGFMSAQSFLYKNLPIQPETDIVPVSLIGTTPYLVLVNAAMPINNMQELVAYAQKNPGKINFASSGIGSAGHLVGETIQAQAKIKLTHVPYKGTGQAMADVLSGQVQLIFDQPISSYKYVQSGNLRALGVANLKRLSSLPNVPSVAESVLPGFDLFPWTGLCAAKNTPQPVLDRVQRAVATVLKQPDIAQRLTADGVEIVGSTPGEFAEFLKADRRKWRTAIETAKIQPE